MDKRKPHENLSPKRKVCADCEGFGTRDNGDVCATCNGHGSVPDRESAK